MSTYYKYCDQLDVLKILGSLQLKLPYISDVNDPLECRPNFVVNTDFSSAKDYYLLLLQQKNENPVNDFDNKFRNILNSEKAQKDFKIKAQYMQDDWNKRASLLSVSNSANKAVMWAHYANCHRGAVIGLNFDQLGITPDLVNYSPERPLITLFKKTTDEEWKSCITTKSDSWKYENEHRTVFVEESLRELESKGWACNKDFEGKNTWFLILKAEMIKEVIFGLDADAAFKATIKRIVGDHISHITFFQAKKSEKEYDLELIPIN